MSSTVRLMQLAAGVLLFHVASSLLQEAVFNLPGFDHSVVLSLLQSACVAGLGFFSYYRLEGLRKTPVWVYLLLAVLSASSLMLTNQASHLLNYPTQVVFKSSKLLVVMSIRFLIIKLQARWSGQPKAFRSSSWVRQLEAVAAVVIVAGLILFTHAGAHSARVTTVPLPSNVVLIGVAAVVVALVFDALMYVVQERYCFGKWGATEIEVIFFLYSFATLHAATALLLFEGPSLTSFSFVKERPSFLPLVAAFSICNFMGTKFILKIVAEFNSNSAVMVTSVRKTFTVLGSYLVYPKGFSAEHAVGLGCVVSGVGLYEMVRNRAKHEERQSGASPV